MLQQPQQVRRRRARRDHEPYRALDELQQRNDRERLQPEDDEHGVVAADMVGDPSPEGPGQAVQDPIQLDGEDQGGHAEGHDRLVHLIKGSNGLQLGRDRQAGEGYERHHEIDGPEGAVS
jgi:hypothetical protein